MVWARIVCYRPTLSQRENNISSSLFVSYTQQSFFIVFHYIFLYYLLLFIIYSSIHCIYLSLYIPKTFKHIPSHPHIQPWQSGTTEWNQWKHIVLIITWPFKKSITIFHLPYVIFHELIKYCDTLVQILNIAALRDCPKGIVVPCDLYVLFDIYTHMVKNLGSVLHQTKHWGLECLEPLLFHCSLLCFIVNNSLQQLIITSIQFNDMFPISACLVV